MRSAGFTIATLLLILPLSANAGLITLSFSGEGDSSSGVADELDLVSGTVTFDDSIFFQLESSYQGFLEYPYASIEFTWSRYSGGSYSDIDIYTQPIVQSTYYSDFRMLTNSTPETALTYWNLDSDTSFYSASNMNAGSNASLIFGGSATNLDDLLALTATEFQYAYRCSGCVGTARANFDNIQVSLVSTVPEPSTLGLIGIGLFGMALARRKRA